MTLFRIRRLFKRRNRTIFNRVTDIFSYGNPNPIRLGWTLFVPNYGIRTRYTISPGFYTIRSPDTIRTTVHYA